MNSKTHNSFFSFPLAAKRSRFSALLLMTLTLPVLVACSSREPMNPVIGQIHVDGQPAAGAIVVLHRNDADAPAPAIQPKPTARVNADGQFVIGTFERGDGAREGQYTIAISWLGDSSQINPVTGEPPLRLAADYASPQTSPLRFEVKPGQNEIPPLQLKKIFKR